MKAEEGRKQGKAGGDEHNGMKTERGKTKEGAEMYAKLEGKFLVSSS